MSHRTNSSSCKKEVIGSADNFWIWRRDSGWDLTHPPTPDAEPLKHRLHLNCEISNVDIDPHKTALLIIDMQNYTMRRELGTNTAGPALFQAQDALLKYGIPAARTAGIQIIWVNWGLTHSDFDTMPPSAIRVFGWRANSEMADYGISARPAALGGEGVFIRCGERLRTSGLGAELGELMLQHGIKIDAGRVLMRDTWNVDLHGPLLSTFEEGQTAPRSDVLIHKNRNSGLWNETTDLAKYLKEGNIRTLLFTGANTDQCVMATLQDAHAQGFDTILLKDGCATDSPGYAQQSAEFNCCRNWGFLSTCSALAQAVFIDQSESL